MKKVAALLFIFGWLSHTLFGQLNWQHTYGPEGGSVLYLYQNKEFAFCPDEFYLYRTRDGANWQRLNMPNLWPIATAGAKVVAVQGYGFGMTPKPRLAVSYDNGDTWIEGTLPTGADYTELAATSNKTFMLGGSQNLGIIFQSDDDGLTWETLQAPTNYLYNLWAYEDRLYASTSFSVWRLDLDGRTWQKISPVFPSQHYVYEVFAEGALVGISTERSIWISTDYGQTWNTYPSSFNNSGHRFVKVGNRIYKDGAGGDFLIYTDNFGKNWQTYPITVGYSALDLGYINSKLLFATPNKGVMYLDTLDKTMKPANNGLTSASVYHLKADSKRLWAACGNGVFSYDLAQQQWSTVSNVPIPRNHYDEIAVSPNGSIATFERYRDTFFLSIDGGITWQKRPSPDDSVVKLFWDGESLYLTGEGYGWITQDYGINWSRINQHLSSVTSFNGKYYAALSGLVKCSNTLAGPWVTVSNSPKNAHKVYSSGDRLFCLAYGTFELALFSSSDGAVWRYSSNGLNWSSGSSNPFEDAQNCGVVSKDGRYIFWEPNLAGIFISLDTCQTWLPVERTSFTTMACVDTTLFAGEFGGGVLKSGLPQQYGALSIGRIFKDDNNNGQYDVGELPLSRTKVSLYEPGAWYPFWYDFTDENGYYHLGSLPNASDTIRPHINTPYVSSITPPYHLVTGSASGRDFAVKLLENVTDAEVSHHLLGVPRPGFKINGHVTLSNRGTIPVSGRLGVKFDPTYHVASATPAPVAVFGDSLVWDINDLAVFSDTIILFEGRLDSLAPLGGCFRFHSIFYPTVGDATPSNNRYRTCENIRGSFDPNEKYVEPALGLSHADIVAGKELTYTIRFQNTGTWPAERVRITDQLDTALDWRTFRFLEASHAITSMRLLPTGVFEVVFDHINLPDSTTNEPASHGSIRFAIQRKKVYRANYAVENKALIFFDFNAPIQTNTVKSPLIKDVVGTKNPASDQEITAVLNLVPNPAHTQCVVDCNGTLQGNGELIVTNMLGALIYRQKIERLELPVVLQTGKWSSGMYLVQMVGKKGKVAGKLLVE